MKLVRFKNKNGDNVVNRNQLEIQYPINKVEIFYDNLDHSNWLGFTWELIAKGRTLVGIDTNDTDFNQIGKTGGSKFLQEHRHYIGKNAGAGSETAWGFPSEYNTNMGDIYTENAGTGHSGNLQPYEVVAYWRRIA